MGKSTSLVPEATIPSDDSKVLAEIEATFRRALGDTDSTYRMGIRNSDGIVYREVTMNSIDQLAAIANRLHKLGFTQEMDEEGGMIDGYDGTFRR